MENIEGRFSSLKERVKRNPSEFLDEVRDEIAELRSHYMIEKEHRMQFKGLKDFYQRNMIKGNPTMYSKRFSEALEELKRAAEERRSKK